MLTSKKVKSDVDATNNCENITVETDNETTGFSDEERKRKTGLNGLNKGKEKVITEDSEDIFTLLCQ